MRSMVEGARGCRLSSPPGRGRGGTRSVTERGCFVSRVRGRAPLTFPHPKASEAKRSATLGSTPGRSMPRGATVTGLSPPPPG